MCVSSSCGHPGPTIKGGSFSPNAREEQHGVALTAAAAPGPSKMAFLSLGTKPLPVTRARGCAIRCFCWLQIVCMTASPTHPRALGPRTQRDSVTATCPSAEMEAGRLGGGVGVAGAGGYRGSLASESIPEPAGTGHPDWLGLAPDWEHSKSSIQLHPGHSHFGWFAVTSELFNFT
jgi:hypothetical protein